MHSFSHEHTLSGLLDIYVEVEPLSDEVTMLNLLRSCQTVFQSDCATWHSHPQSMHVLMPHILTSTCFYVFLIIAMLVGVKWHLCGFDSHFPNEIGHLSWLLAIYLPCLEKCLLRPFAHLLADFCLFLVMSFFAYSGHNSLIRNIIWKYFFLFSGLLFRFLNGSRTSF